MDPKELRGLYEAYTAVYDEDLRDDLEEMSDEFAGIENLTDEEIDAIVEETIDEMLDEGYEFEEVEEIFEEVLSEAARMDRAAARREYMRSSEKAAGEARKRGAAVVRRERRAEQIAKVKGAVKSALGRARDAVRAARKGVSKRIDSAKSSATQAAMRATNVKPSDVGSDKKGRPLNKGNFDTRYSKNRAKARKAIGDKIKTKIAQAQVGAYNVARRAGQAASDVAGRAKQSAKNLATRTKRGVMSTAGKAARAVSTGAGRVASRLGEEVDVYDVILSHLLDEGYADSVESAERIMVSMSEEWRDEILDEMQYTAPPQPAAIVRPAPSKINRTPSKINQKGREINQQRSKGAGMAAQAALGLGAIGAVAASNRRERKKYKM